MLYQHAQTEHFTPLEKTQRYKYSRANQGKSLFLWTYQSDITWARGQGQGDDLATLTAVCRRLKAQIQLSITLKNCLQ